MCSNAYAKIDGYPRFVILCQFTQCHSLSITDQIDLLLHYTNILISPPHHLHPATGYGSRGYAE